MSRIRWISAPRCWILEHHRRHHEREKGTHQDRRPAAGKEPWSGWLDTWGGPNSEEIEPAQRCHFVIQSWKVMVEIMKLETN